VAIKRRPVAISRLVAIKRRLVAIKRRPVAISRLVAIKRRPVAIECSDIERPSDSRFIRAVSPKSDSDLGAISWPEQFRALIATKPAVRGHQMLRYRTPVGLTFHPRR
jgi:hypothetical protein